MPERYGYTTLRVRGTDGTRINVTANGIPINDAESHNVFLGKPAGFRIVRQGMQIQRGAGTSTNGAGAFGPVSNMQTGDFSLKPYAELNGSYGSFNTHKETVKSRNRTYQRPLVFFDARLSNISSDGYIDRASVGLNSYYLQGGYYSDNTSIKLITFGGKSVPTMPGIMPVKKKWRNTAAVTTLAGICTPTTTAPTISMKTKRTTTYKRTTNCFSTTTSLPPGM